MHQCYMRGQIYRCTNDNRKENLGKRKCFLLSRKNPTDHRKKKTNLEQREILPSF